MTLSNLNEAELKDFCKLIKLDDFKKVAKHQKSISTMVIRELGKSPDRIQKSIIDQYILDHSDEENGLIYFLIDMVDTKFSRELPNYRYFADYVCDKEYDEIDHDDESVSAIKEAYGKAGYKLQFESFLKLHCKEAQADAANMVEKLQKENTKLSEELADQRKKSEDQQKTINDLKNTQKEKSSEYQSEIRKLKQENDKLNNVFTVKTNKKNVETITGKPSKGRTYRDLYEELNQYEEKAFNEKSYEKLKDVLAAKYALITSMERN